MIQMTPGPRTQTAAQASGPSEGERCFPKDHMRCVTRTVRTRARQAGQHVLSSAAPTPPAVWRGPGRGHPGSSWVPLVHTPGGSLRVSCQASAAVLWVTFRSAKNMSFLPECSRSWRETEATNCVYRPLLEQLPVARRQSVIFGTGSSCVALPTGALPTDLPGRQLSTWTPDH